MAGKNDQEVVGILSLTDVARLHPAIYSKMMDLQNTLTPQMREQNSSAYIQ